MRRTCLIVVIAFAALLVLAPISAGRGWVLPATAVSDPVNEALGPQTVVDSTGAVTVVWREFNTSKYVIRAARRVGGVWSAPVTLSDPGKDAANPQLVADGAGVVTAAWLVDEEDVEATRFVGGAWTSAVVISGTGHDFAPRLAANADGTVMALWRSRDVANSQEMRAARFAAGAWSANVAIATYESSSGYSLDTEYALTIDGDGAATALWHLRNRSTSTSTVAAARFTAPTGGVAAAISGADTGSVDWLEAAVGADGAVVAVWVETSGGLDPLFNLRSNRFASGAWGTRVALATAAQLDDPDVAIDADGEAIAIWETGSTIRTARRGSGGWSAGVEIPTTGTPPDVSSPELAVSSAGAVHAVWVAEAAAPVWTVLHAARYEDGAWTASVPLSAASGTQQNLGARDPSIAVDGAGVATAAWKFEDTGTDGVIQAARYALDPAAPTGATATASGTSATVAWTVSVSDGGAPLTSAAATATPGGRSCTAPAPATTCTIDGLDYETSYTFTVVAANAVGVSPASAPSSAVTTGPAPVAPASAMAAPVAPASATATIARLGGRFALRRGVGTTRGTAPVATTRVVQTASRVRTGRAASLGRATKVAGKCALRKRAYTCDIRLGKGSWRVMTTARGARGVLASSVRTVRVR